MYHKDYSNFVRPIPEKSIVSTSTNFPVKKLSGNEARKLYLEEIRITEDSRFNRNCPDNCNVQEKKHCKTKLDCTLSDQELFQSVQNNVVHLVKSTLDSFPDKVNLKDDFGWSLLMIACQANSVDVVKELLKHGVDTSVRDKAGNSAQSLVIKNKNKVLADIFLNQPVNDIAPKTAQVKLKKQEYKCSICDNILFSDKDLHLSSTLHNINASKGKKIPMKYVIPESNKGFQIMLKEGWDKDTGLGPDGSGVKYPIKATMKKDRMGLGLKKKQEIIEKKSPKNINKNLRRREERNNKLVEIRFRREFY